MGSGSILRMDPPECIGTLCSKAAVCEPGSGLSPDPDSALHPCPPAATLRGESPAVGEPPGCGVLLEPGGRQRAV